MNKQLVNERTSFFLFISIFMLYAFVYTTKMGFSAAIAAIVKSGYFSKGAAGAINAAFYLTYAAGQIAGGFIADRLSPYKLILFGLIGAAVCNLSMGFANGFVPMVIIWSINALAQFGIWPSIVKILAENLADVHRAKAIVYICLASVCGTVFSYGIAAFVKQWRDNFFISAGLMLVVAIAWYFISKHVTKRLVLRPAPQVTQEKKEVKAISNSSLLIKNGLLLLAVAHCLMICVGQGVTIWVPTMVIETYRDASTAFASSIVIIISVFTALSVLVTGFLYPNRVRKIIWAAIVFGLVTLPFSGALLLNGRISIVPIIASLCLLTLFNNLSDNFVNMPLAPAFAFCGKTATISGIINAAASIGFVIASYAFGVLSDALGWTGIIMIWFGLLVLRILLMVIALPLWNKFVKAHAS